MNNNFNNSEIVDFILNNYNIVDIVSNYIKIEKKGNNFWAICPFHQDTKPSLSISTKKNIFNCFSCNVGGNAIFFVKNFKKISYFEAIKDILKILNINDPEILNLLKSDSKIDEKTQKLYDTNKHAAEMFYLALYDENDTSCFDYLIKKRKISRQIIDLYQLGYAPKRFKKNFISKVFESNQDLNNNFVFFDLGLKNLNDNGEYTDFFYNRMIIPIKNENGYIVGFCGRALDEGIKEKYINTKSNEIFKKEEILFNFYSFNKKDYEEIFVVEGYMDVFSFVKIGIKNVVATMGTSFTEKQIELIKKYKNIKRIIICFDNDNAGLIATKKSIKKLSKHNFQIYVVKPFDIKFKDVDQLVNSIDENSVKKILNDQTSYIEYEILFFNRSDNKDRKSIITKTTELIDLINDFAYDDFFINDDLKKLSEFSGISIDILNQKIRKHFNRFKFENQKNIYFSNKENKNFFKNKGFNNKNFQSNEIELFLLSLFNYDLAVHFKKFYNIIYFCNDDQEKKEVLNIMSILIDDFIEKKDNFNIKQSLFNIFKNNLEIKSSSINLLKKIIKNYYNTQFKYILLNNDKKNHTLQGLNQIYKLNNELYKIKLLSLRKNNSSNKEILNLIFEKDSKLKKIKKTIDSIK